MQVTLTRVFIFTEIMQILALRSPGKSRQPAAFTNIGCQGFSREAIRLELFGCHFNPLSSTPPPSSTADSNGNEREKIIVSQSGHIASIEDIIASYQALQTHIQKRQEDAERTIREWEENLRKEELAEKRRVAPGWLDREEKILQPARAATDSPAAGQG
ncbi:MAG: hypothetical protein Q9171_003869 [Xanthocarpia ochracea]